MTGLRVAVVAGGPSSEAEVSRTSARAVSGALAGADHRVTVLELDANLAAELVSGGYDVAFPVTHGPLGEDGCLQGLLEVLGLPYVGSGVLASALAASKPHAKTMFRRAGLPVAPEALVARGEDLHRRSDEVRAALGAAVVVKPASGGSAIGVSRVRQQDASDVLAGALARALEVDAVALVEQLVDGHEVTCGVLEDEAGVPRALAPTLILSRAADWYDFTSRYRAGGSEHQCPAPFEPDLTQSIQGVAVAAHRALGARDLSRVDFVVSADAGGVTLLEVNTLPGMTATSLFPEAAAVGGVDFVTLCDRLARQAYARPRREVPPARPMP
jgi:D-alanine-D-alanine ligase